MRQLAQGAVALEFGKDLANLGVPFRIVFFDGYRVGFFIQRLACQFEALVLIQARFCGHQIGKYRVQPLAGTQPEVLKSHVVVVVRSDLHVFERVLQWLVFGAIDNQILVQVAFVAGGAGQADLLAAQVLGRMDTIIRGVDHDHRRRGVVLDREVEHFGAGLARRHRADADVITAAPVARGDHVPGRCFEAQFDAQFLRHGLGDVDIEAVQFILVIQEREGR